MGSTSGTLAAAISPRHTRLRFGQRARLALLQSTHACYRASTFIAPSSPSSVSGNIRPPISVPIWRIDWV